MGEGPAGEAGWARFSRSNRVDSRALVGGSRSDRVVFAFWPGCLTVLRSGTGPHGAVMNCSHMKRRGSSGLRRVPRSC